MGGVSRHRPQKLNEEWDALQHQSPTRRGPFASVIAPPFAAAEAAKGFRSDQPRSKRSAFITFVQAVTKSRTNFSLLSSCAYNSA